MKVILLQNVPALGRKNDIKEVRGGYARNFLFPRNLAKPVTEESVRLVAAAKERDAREKSEKYQKHKMLAENLGTLTLSFKVKMGEKGKAFGSVTAAKIRDELKKHKVEVEKEWVLLEEPIKTTGEHTVKIKFPHEIEGKIKVVVEAE